MFFSYSILVSKNSNFAVIWKYMHDRHGIAKVSKRELLSIDIARACEDLQNYIPTGVLLKSELRDKMSLYLLAQLSYGITLVFQAHVNYLITDLETAIKSFARFPEENKREKTPRKSTTGRKRRLAELDGVVEAVMAVPRGMEPEDMEEEDDEGAKRRRISAPRKASKLDLADPSAYVDQQLPAARDVNDQSMLMDESSRLDDMFMDQTVQPALPPPDWVAEPNDSLPFGESAEGVRRSSQQKVSMMSILMGEDTLMEEVGKTVTVAPNLSALQPPVEDLELELPMEMTRDPIYKKRSTDEQQSIDIVADSADRLQLDALPDIDHQSKSAHPKKRKRLLVDEQLQLGNQEMIDRFNNYDDLLRTRDDLHREIMQPDEPKLSQLLDPRPYHIKALNPELFPLFDTVRAEHRERPLTFDEAQAMTFEDMRKRRLEFDLQSWHSNDEPTPLRQRVEESFGDAGGEQRREQTQGKEKTAELTAHRPSSVLEGEAMRRDTTGEGNRRITDYSFGQPGNEQIMADLDRTQLLPMDEIVADTELMQESVVTREHSSLGPLDEQSVDDNTRDLYSRLNRGGVASFEELLKSESFGETKRLPITRAVVARKFFALLNLLKHRMVKVRQRTPYGEILIRARNLENDGEQPSFTEHLQ
ncbi:hypothetical protein niasHT_016859 [Heterodera trifolii]|uniref:Uncharacterized protein n=1 Tax=Heterodera trifolii TaxID=157864 RepID=A0ABD2KTA4_9BILA